MDLISQHIQFKPNGREFKFVVFLILFALILATLIYWRQDSVQDQISFQHVLLWQLGIWIPWAFAFPIFNKIINRLKQFKFRKILIYGSNLIWILMHFAWFFYISSNFSPYFGFPETRYGVYPYFFIFWTLVDFGLMWFVLEKLNHPKAEKHSSKLSVIELVRGDTKYYCEPDKVYWLSAEDYYTKLYTDQGIFLIRKPLQYFHEKLPQEDFLRIHRSTVVNIKYVSEIVRGKNESLEVVLKDGAKRRVSRKYSKEIKTIFQNRSL